MNIVENMSWIKWQNTHKEFACLNLKKADTVVLVLFARLDDASNLNKPLFNLLVTQKKTKQQVGSLEIVFTCAAIWFPDNRQHEQWQRRRSDELQAVGASS